MISKMNYLLLSTVMIAAIDSTFGRGCDCCKKLCADKDSNESFPNSENNNTNLEDKLLKDNENTRPINNTANIHHNNNNLIGDIANNYDSHNINGNNNFFPGNNIDGNNNFYNINWNNDFSLENFRNNNNIENMKGNNDFSLGNNIGSNNNIENINENNNPFQEKFKDNNNSNLEQLILQKNNIYEEDENKKKETLYFKIAKVGLGKEGMGECFNKTW